MMIGETPLTGLLDRDRRECDLENRPCFLSILEEGSVSVGDGDGERFGAKASENK